jgi:hypothetical protein
VLWYGLRTRPLQETEAAPERGSSCQYVQSQGGLHGLAPWEQTLHIWTRLADPTLLVLPDEELGFSQVRDEPRPMPETPVPEYLLVVKLADEAEQPVIRLAEPYRGLPDEMRLRWSLAKPESWEHPALVPLPRTLVWHRPDGQVMQNMPTLDAGSIREAIKAGGDARYPTRVEVFASSSERPGRVRVRRSSGNTLLDMLVVAALRQAIGRYERDARFFGLESRPMYLPEPGGSAFLEIEWSLLPAESGPGE